MSDKIIVKGKLIAVTGLTLYQDDIKRVDGYAAIKLSPQELAEQLKSEIKAFHQNDEVWVRAYLQLDYKNSEILNTIKIAGHIFPIIKNQIIVHLPQPQQEHSKQDKDGNPIWKKPQQEKCPKEAKPEKTFELEKILHRLLSRYKEGIVSYTIKGESHWDKELEISCAVKEIKRWAEQSEKPESASVEELRDIIHKHTSEMLDNPDDYGIYPTTKFYNNLIHALVGKVRKIEPQNISIDILADAYEGGNLISPFKLGKQEIQTLGIYEEKGIKFWVIKKNDRIKPEPQKEIEELFIGKEFTEHDEEVAQKIQDKLNEIIKHINRKD